MSASELRTELEGAGVRLNEYATTLLDNPAFEDGPTETISVAILTPAELGQPDGACLSQIYAAALDYGLELCPAVTGPYLRLAFLDQPSAPDTVMSNGRAPSASITIASAPLSDDDEYPKGFYLRVVEDVRWLRGYVGDDTHIWSPTDQFAFCVVRP